MHLKKLEICGFKSFADKTEVIFDKGVTCVVGPNGCGKSNISDSIRWVLGERSAKLLRGSKMEDVIFNGTDFRKPLSFAEVSLTFDNHDRGLPIDYSEVTLTRRLYRSGQSEYYINKTLVRLKDLQNLILDTGVGSNSYSMIEQGRIDYVLNADPEERRFLIEEAAGISKYKVKKEEALRKLDRTEQNMLRLKDIVHEVEKNIQYAERQAKRAEKFREKYEYLKDLEIRKAFRELEWLKGEGDSHQIVRNEREDALRGLESKKADSQTELTDQEKLVLETQTKHSEKETNRFTLQTKREKSEQQILFNREKRVEMATRKGEIQQEQAQLDGRLRKNEEEIAAKQQEIGRLGAEKKQIVSELESYESKQQGIISELSELKDKFEKGKVAVYEMAAEMTRVKNEFHRMLAFLESSDKQKNKMDGNLGRYSKERKAWEEKQQDFSKQIQDVCGEMEKAEANHGELKVRIAEFEEKMKAEELGKVGLERRIHEKTARLEMLKELDASLEIDKEKMFKDLPELEKSLVRGMRDIVKVRKGYEWALEAALGSYAESLIVEDKATAEKLVNYLSSQKARGFGIWIKGNGVTQSGSDRLQGEGIRCAMKDVVEVAPGYESMFESILNRTYVVESLENKNLDYYLNLTDQYRFVTQEGVCLGPDSQIYFRLGLNQEQSFFQRGDEIAALEGSLRQDQEALNLNHARKEELNNLLQVSQTELETILNHITELRIKRESIESFRRGVMDRLDSHGREVQLVMQEILELEGQREEVAARKEKLSIKLEEMTAQEKRQMDSENALLKSIEAKENERTEMLGILADRRARLGHLEEQIGLIEQGLNFIRDNDRQDRERIQSLSDETGRIAQKNQELDDWDVKLQEDMNVLENDVRQADVALEILKQEKSKLESRIQVLKDEIFTLSEKQSALQRELHESEMKGMDIGYKEKAIHERLTQAYHIKLMDLKPEDFPWEERKEDQVDEEIAKLREKVEGMGTVNLLAIEEYEELKKRYDFLISQRTDLENSRTELLEAIRKINRTTKDLFETTFTRVQETFTEYYQTLFRGGEAKMVLVDEAHPLESGIDIMVRPPGKRNQHISLLSGGEKALTAIALLFALFKIKPSPYSVLDEVDAPLDEANIDRFLTVLRTFIDSTQFIIITHNRKTIAMGDSLYGITMEEAGVSKLVSVKVSADEATPETAVDTEKDTVEDSVSA